MSIQAQAAGRPAPRRRAALAIEAADLVKTYPKDIRALDGLSFSVAAGIVFGLLGPNGAGQVHHREDPYHAGPGRLGPTRPSPGSTCGRSQPQVRRVIGVVAQQSGADPIATGRENLLLTGRFQGLRGRRPEPAGRRTAQPGSRWPTRPGRTGAHLLRRDAAPARRGPGPDPPAGGAVPGRADRRPGPGVALRDVGRDRPAVRQRGTHHPAHHALPGRGRPAGQPAGHRGPGPGRRGGHPG